MTYEASTKGYEGEEASSEEETNSAANSGAGIPVDAEGNDFLPGFE
jgi:hypothetical protein